MKLRKGMGFKFLLISVGISLVVVLASSFLILTFQRQQIIDTAQEEITHLSETIEASLEHALQEQDWTLADRIIQNESVGAALDQIKILDIGGKVRISTNEAEVGRKLDYSDPSCQFCHTEGSKPDSLTRIVDLGGQQVLLNVNMLREQYACPTCTSQNGELLGVLYIEKPLTEIKDNLLAAFSRIVVVGIFAFIMLLVLLSYAYHRVVLEPVLAINEGVNAVAAGDLEVSVPETSQDELGELAQAFNEMQRQLKTSRDDLEQRARERKMINEIALASGELLDPRQIVELALETVVEKLGMQAGFIFLYDHEQDRFTLQASRGLTPEIEQKIEMHRSSGSGPDISAQVIQTRQPYFIPDMSTESYFQDIWEDLKDRSFVNIPLISRGTAVGTLVLLTYPGQPLKADRLEYLTLVGHVIGIAFDNATLLARAQEHELESRQIYELVTEVSTLLDADQVLRTIAINVRQIMQVDLCLAGVFDESREEIVIDGVAGAHLNTLDGSRIPLNDCWVNCILDQPKGKAVHELNCDQAIDSLREALESEGMDTFLAKPLYRIQKMLGLILIARLPGRPFLKNEIQKLARVAQQVSVAIENAELYSKVGYLATVEERERLAREMHDRLAQAIGYLNLKTSITEGLLDADQFGPAKNSLRELKQLSLETYTDVREAIFNLRTTLTAGLRFLPTLEAYIREYRFHYGLNVHLVTNDIDLALFSPDVDIQLLRIIQEALTNVRKHAQASQVWIRFKRVDQGAWVEVTIEDDGRGFDPHSIQAALTISVGLQILRERAESVGGHLVLDSKPGGGTRVVVRIPDLQTEKKSGHV